MAMMSQGIVIGGSRSPVSSARARNRRRPSARAAGTPMIVANTAFAVASVTLPLLLPGVVAGLLFAFTVSFDNFVISYFLAPPGVSTLPVEIYSAIRAGFTPEVNAVSAIIFVLSMGVLVLTSRFTRFV